MIINKIQEYYTHLFRLVHCNLENNDYHQDSRVLYTFVPNKPSGSLLEISPTNHIFLEPVN